MPWSAIGDGEFGDGDLEYNSDFEFPASLGYQGYYILPEESTKKVRVCPWAARKVAGYSREKVHSHANPLLVLSRSSRALNSVSEVVSF